MFSNAILLWSVQYCEFHCDTISGTVVLKCCVDVLSTLIRPQDLCVGLVVVHKKGVHFDEPGSEVRFSKAWVKPQEASFVVNQDTKVLLLP